MSIQVKLKHGKLAHDTTVEPADTGATFKGRVYQLTGSLACRLALRSARILCARLDDSRTSALFFSSRVLPCGSHLLLAGVPADRQKVLTKRSWKGPLKDDAVMASMAIKAGQKFMLTGTSTGIPSAPDAAVVFVEDMTDAQKAATVEVLKSGLVNMGNTCYLNATLQCLRFVPELRSSLASFADTRATGGDANGALAMALSRLFDKLDASVDPVLPSTFVPLLRSFVPTPFAERTAGGHFKQQDADSFLNHIMAHVLGALPEEKARELFGVRLATTLKCLETDDEPNVDQMEHNMKLRCNIMGGGGSTTKIDFMRDGIKLALAPDGGEQIEKASAVLGRNAAWKRESKVDSLPKYLCVQFVRFDSKRHRTTGGDVEVRVVDSVCILMSPRFVSSHLVSPLCSSALRAPTPRAAPLLPPPPVPHATIRFARAKSSVR